MTCTLHPDGRWERRTVLPTVPPLRALTHLAGLLGVREPQHQTPQNCCAPVQRAPPGGGAADNLDNLAVTHLAGRPCIMTVDGSGRRRPSHLPTVPSHCHCAHHPPLTLCCHPLCHHPPLTALTHLAVAQSHSNSTDTPGSRMPFSSGDSPPPCATPPKKK